MTQIEKLQKAIEIQGSLPIQINGVAAKFHAVRVVGTRWLIDIRTPDLSGTYEITRASRPVYVHEAESIIARETEIRAARAAATRSFYDL